MAATPRSVIQCEPARPTLRPNRPARIAPASGASTIASSTVFEIANSMPGIIPSALQGIDFGPVYRAPVAEPRDQDRQADRGLGRGPWEDQDPQHHPSRVTPLPPEPPPTDPHREHQHP